MLLPKHLYVLSKLNTLALKHLSPLNGNSGKHLLAGLTRLQLLIWEHVFLQCVLIRDKGQVPDEVVMHILDHFLQGLPYRWAVHRWGRASLRINLDQLEIIAYRDELIIKFECIALAA